MRVKLIIKSFSLMLLTVFAILAISAMDVSALENNGQDNAGLTYYESSVKNGLYYENGSLHYYTNDEWDFNFQGIAEYNGELYYVQYGGHDSSYIGLYYYNGEYCFIFQGKLDAHMLLVV